jgi:hypothetical protein
LTADITNPGTHDPLRRGGSAQPIVMSHRTVIADQFCATRRRKVG